MNGGTRPDRVCGWLTVLWLALATGATAAESAGPAPAERLVVEALQAEAAGDVDRRGALLDEAVRAAPDLDLARWSRGEIRADGRWLPIDEAQRAAANDPRHLEYLTLRANYGQQPEAQLDLARWCRRNDLTDEARIHWANVLSYQPDNEEALRALGAAWFHGRLMTYAQIDAAKRDMREVRRAAKLFKPRLAKWQRMLSAGDIASRDAALDEVRSIANVDAIPAIEEATLGADIDTTADQERCRYLGLAFVEALGAMPDPAAAASLARHAVLSPVSDVRAAAIERLKERPMQDYVPLLLDALAMPIESAFQVTTDPDGSVHYRHSLYVDGRQADWSLENVRNLWQVDLGGRRALVDRAGYLRGYDLPGMLDHEAAATIANVAGQHQRQFAGAAAAIERQVAEANATAVERHKLIIPVLAKTTGQDLGDNPQDWWSWWQRYSEYDTSEREPVHERRYSESDERYYRYPSTGDYAQRKTRPIMLPTKVERGTGFRYGTGGRYPAGSGYSGGVTIRCCLPRGTLVWTNTGQRAIETIEIGDLVLSQNTGTGELAYQPVVGRTVRPPSPTLKLTLGKEELRTTLGHPLWVSGIGWRMAKQVGETAILHGVRGPVEVDAVEPAEDCEAFNLVVADFNTYFVGESGILVHDNTPRRPTAAVVPGLVPE